MRDKHFLIYNIDLLIFQFKIALSTPVITHSVMRHISSDVLNWNIIINSVIIIAVTLLYNKFESICYKYYWTWIAVDSLIVNTIIYLFIFDIISHSQYWLFMGAEFAFIYTTILMNLNMKKSFFEQEKRKSFDNSNITWGNIGLVIGSIIGLITQPSLTVALILVGTAVITSNILTYFFIKIK